MARKSAEHKFLFIASTLVVLMGMTTVSSIVEEPLDTSSTQDVRAPAAVATGQATVRPSNLSSASAEMMNFDFNCKKEIKKEVAVRGGLLQIRGSGCLKEAKGEILIVNKSNGYTASIFDRGGGDFQTDLIQLVEGHNEIFIQYKNAQGKKLERQVLVKSSHI